MASEGLQKKSLDSPDETGTFENGKVRIVTLGDFNASRLVLEPGWRWSENVKPIAGTDSCQVLHTGYHVFRVGCTSGWTTALRWSAALATLT
jgi:hypothetical protein